MKIFVVLALVVAGGCVQARDPRLVAVKGSGDSALSCEQIATEYKANTEIARNKIDKNRANDTREFFLGILVWPGLMDMKNADGNEGNALLDRNVYLLELAKSKPCVGVESWSEQPRRYTMKGYRMAQL
ncbi:MAG TPA: hypothetical protein VEB61_12155 [Candidatus Binatia bacterium]|nr:hypothetical protein [Candidatus Binatia bacterium]